MYRWNDVSESSASGARRGPLRAAFRLASLAAALGIVTLMLGAAGAARAQSTMRSPESVQTALGILSQVVADSGKLIAARRYDQLPRESNEFEAAVTVLEQGLGNQSSTLKSKLEPLVGKARVASSAMREAVEAHRDSMLPLAHRQLAQAVSEIIASFPASLRPAAGNGA